MYDIQFTPIGSSDFAKLDKSVAQRVLKKLRWVAENFENINPEALTGDWHNVFKLRVGEWRILYTFDSRKKKITIHFVRHRGDVYKIK